MGKSTGSNQQLEGQLIDQQPAATNTTKQRTAAKQYSGASAVTPVSSAGGGGGGAGGGGGTTPTPATDENARQETSGLVGVKTKPELPKVVPAGEGGVPAPEKPLTKEQIKYQKRKERNNVRKAEAAKVTGFNPSAVPTPVKATPKQTLEIQNMITNVIAGGFGLASVKAGAHWQLTQPEAQSLGVPLTKMLEKYDLFNKIAEHSDAAALITAAAMIVTPRVMVSINQSKNKPKEVRSHVQPAKPIQTRATETGSQNSDAAKIDNEIGGANNGFTPSGTHSVKSVLAFTGG